MKLTAIFLAGLALFVPIIFVMYSNEMDSEISRIGYGKVYSKVKEFPFLKPIVSEYMSDGYISYREYCSLDIEVSRQALIQELGLNK